MKKTILVGLGIVTIALLVAGCGTQANQQPPTLQKPQAQESPNQQPIPNSIRVTIKDFKFSPADLTLKQGDTVTWTNEDDVQHTVKFDFKESSKLSKGGTFSFTFYEKGTYTYHCGIHPSMTGRIIIT